LARTRALETAFAVGLFTGLLGLFDTTGFLAEAAFASLFAAPRVRDAAAADLFRFSLEGFDAMFFILARIAFGTTRALDAGLRLPTRLRTLDDNAFLEALFDAVFALEAGLTFFVFDFVVFFDLLRAAIVILSTREYSRTDENPCASTASNTASGLSINETTLCPWTPVGLPLHD
jgi:hypothetical protein